MKPDDRKDAYSGLLAPMELLHLIDVEFALCGDDIEAAAIYRWVHGHSFPCPHIQWQIEAAKRWNDLYDAGELSWGKLGDNGNARKIKIPKQ